MFDYSVELSSLITLLIAAMKETDNLQYVSWELLIFEQFKSILQMEIDICRGFVPSQNHHLASQCYFEDLWLLQLPE
jgi:hypothetical protein